MSTHPLRRVHGTGAMLALLVLAGHAALAQAPLMPRPSSLVAASTPVTGPASAPATGPASAPTGPARSADDIRDIRGPKKIPSIWLLPLTVLTVFAAIGGTYLAWAWNRRRFREASKRPLDIALDRLEKARALMQPTRGREFSIEVSGVVRDYIESRFQVRAAHLTTDEFLRDLLEPAGSLRVAHRGLLEHRALLENFLQICDLAKFGGWNLGADEMEAILQSARQFVIESANTAELAATAEPTTSAEPAAAAEPVPVDRPDTAARPDRSTSRKSYVSLSST